MFSSGQDRRSNAKATESKSGIVRLVAAFGALPLAMVLLWAFLSIPAAVQPTEDTTSAPASVTKAPEAPAVVDAEQERVDQSITLHADASGMLTLQVADQAPIQLDSSQPIIVEGRSKAEKGDGIDTFTYTSSGAALEIDLANQQINDPMRPSVAFKNMDVVQLSAKHAPVQVQGSAADDVIHFEPTQRDAGYVYSNGNEDTTWHIRDLDTLAIDPGAGYDTVALLGTDGSNAMQMNMAEHMHLTVDQLQPVQVVSATTENWDIVGGAGDDTLTVNMDGSELTHVALNYDGGDDFDTVVIEGQSTIPVDTLTYSPGPAIPESLLQYTAEDTTPSWTSTSRILNQLSIL